MYIIMDHRSDKPIKHSAWNSVLDAADQVRKLSKSNKTEWITKFMIVPTEKKYSNGFLFDK